MKPFCAICTHDITGEPRMFEGATICVDCDEVEMPPPRESFQRSYEGGGGIGTQFGFKVTAAAKRIIPGRVAKLDDDCDRGVVPANEDWDSVPVFGELTAEQIKYTRSRRTNNHSKQKDFL